MENYPTPINQRKLEVPLLQNPEVPFDGYFFSKALLQEKFNSCKPVYGTIGFGQDSKNLHYLFEVVELILSPEEGKPLSAVIAPYRKDRSEEFVIAEMMASLPSVVLGFELTWVREDTKTHNKKTPNETIEVLNFDILRAALIPKPPLTGECN